MIAELLGGTMLILGILVEFFGLVLAIDMLFAIILVKFSQGFSGYRFELVLLLTLLGLALTGPGKLAFSKEK